MEKRVMMATNAYRARAGRSREWHSYLLLCRLFRHSYQFHFPGFCPFAPDRRAFSTHGAHKRPHSYLYHICSLSLIQPDAPAMIAATWPVHMS